MKRSSIRDDNDEVSRLHISPRGSLMTAVACFAQDSEKELPECADRSEVCSKVDLYGAPWVERQCRCPNGRACPSSLHGDDGHTIVDKTRRYKLCEPVKRLPICRYFKLVWITRSRNLGHSSNSLDSTSRGSLYGFQHRCFVDSDGFLLFFFFHFLT